MLVQPCERMCGVTVLRNCATTSIPYGRDTWRSLSHTNEHHQMYRRERTKFKKKKQKHKLRVWCTHHLHTDRSRRTDDCAILKHQYMHNWFNAAKSLAIITSSWIDFKRFRLIMNFLLVFRVLQIALLPPSKHFSSLFALTIYLVLCCCYCCCELRITTSSLWDDKRVCWYRGNKYYTDKQALKEDKSTTLACSKR